MKTIAFISFPVAGHVNPQHGLCEELAKRNVNLVYYTADRYQAKYQDIEGITIRLYPKEFMDYYDELSKDITLHEKMLALMYVFNTFTEKILPFILEDLKEVKPDFIISDSLAVWGKAAARYFNIPCALFFSSFMGDSIIIKKTPSFALSLMKSAIFDFKYVLKFNQIKKRIEKQYGKITDSMSKVMSPQGKFTIVSTSREFHPGGTLYPSNVHFVRPCIFETNPVNTKKDTIFISVGTISFSHSFWDICLKATRNLPYRIVISFGNNKNNSLDKELLRDNVVLYDNLSLDDFRKELERSEIFITHGGFNSITDGIIAETKLLVCPITAEQISNGNVIEGYGCGKLYPEKTYQADVMERELKELIANDEMRKHLSYYKKSFMTEKTYEEVVSELLIEYNLSCEK